MTLPPEKISELKQIIHSHLSHMDIESRIKRVLNESVGGERSGGVQQLNDEDLLNALHHHGLIDDVMKQLQFDSGGSLTSASGQIAPSSKPATHFISKDDKLATNMMSKRANFDPTRRYLYLQVLGGKAFLEHLQQQQPLPGEVSSSFTLHLNFRGQRFRSRPTPCACDPDIQDGFLLELHKEHAGDAAKMADTSSMLSICDKIHLVLIKTEPSGDSVLVSSHFLEWRTVLSAPNCQCTTTVELMGVGTEKQVPVGILEARLELIPRPSDSLTEDIISAQISLERTKQAECERLFLVYAKQWWKEYLEIRPGHQERLVKMFAQDENGNNRPVCSYIRALRSGRLLDTPRQAARFVSLMGFEKRTSLGGGGRPEQWSTIHAFLCCNKGDSEDHAILLCCLLLGFGLDAYVCVGTKSKGAPHTWVVTFGTDGIVTFWESLTGHRYIHEAIHPDDPPAIQQPKPSYPYRTIGCLFNNEAFFANSQASDAVETCLFDLHDESKWKAMSQDALRSISSPSTSPFWPALPPLCGPSLDAALISNDLEMELRVLVHEHRQDQGLMTIWDDHLSYLLTPALAAYETERVTGITAGNEEFQQAIRRAVPDGHTFKGYPIQFIHRNARRAFSACLKSPVAAEIINCRGDHVRLAVRVRVYTYPESACATWLMFACKYKSIL